MTTQNPTSIVGTTTTLPQGWDTYNPQQKIDFFNQNKITPQQLLASGVAQSDIDYMRGQGYTGVAGLTLPQGWNTYTPQQKIAFYNEKKVTPQQLATMGASQSDINYMRSQGYTAGGAGGTGATDYVGTEIDPSQSTLSPNFAQYVYNMLGKAEAAANQDYQPYTGERFAGPSALQSQAFRGIASLKTPEQFKAATEYAKSVGKSVEDLDPYEVAQFTSGLGPVGTVESYMSPYMSAVTDIAAREATRQADISRQAEQARLAQAGAYGGSRQAIMEAERQRNLGQQVSDIRTTGLQSAFDRAMQARQKAAEMDLEAQRYSELSKQFGADYGLRGLNTGINVANALANIGSAQSTADIGKINAQLAAGAQQQALAQQPLDFAYKQWEESMQYPYQQASYMKSILSGLPIQAQPYDSGQSVLNALLQGGLAGLGLTAKP